jgi:DNA-binding LytR/AlgR family response regulator
MTTTAIYSTPYQYSVAFAWNDVVRLEGAGNYTIVIFKDGKRTCYSKSLCVYESRVPAGFLRVHKGCIVNLKYVNSYDRRQKLVQLSDGKQVKVSRRKITYVKKKLNLS